MNVRAMLFSLLALVALASNAFAATSAVVTSVTGVQGYDLVSYHNSKRPIHGNGHFTVVHDGVTYLFANKENKAAFERNPQKYLPAYGGYCAFGVALGKKFVGDPEVWRLVDDRLYLNLDANIQDQWLKDVPGQIKQADANWREIKDRAPGDL